MDHTIRRCACIISLCSMLSPVHTALAAEPDGESDAYELGEVVVSARGDGVQATESLSTVTAEDIKKMNARTLDQAIALLPGVNIRTGGEGVPRIDVRGFRTRHVLLLLDGVPLNSALDAQFDPTVIPTENIAMIKLTRGASSVLYGQGGMGGVINIITKKGIKEFSGMVSAETGDHQPYLARASFSAKKDAFDVFVSGSSTQVDAFPLSDDFKHTPEQKGDYRKNSDRERHNVLTTIGYNPTEDLSLGFTFTYTQGEYGKPASTINDPNDPFASAPKYERIDGFEGLSLQLAGEYQFSDSFSLKGWLFHNQMHQDDNLYDNASYNSFNLSGSYREKIKTRIQGVSLQPRYDMGRAGGISFSLYNEWDHWKNSGEVTNDTFDPHTDKDVSIHTIAAEYEVSPLKGLGLVAGYGYHWQVRDGSNEDGYSINAGIHYDLFDDTRLKFSFNRNIRFPSLGDLYDLSKGNPDLSAERSYTYQGGIEQKLPYNSEISLTGFHTIAKNLIQNDQTTSQNTNLAEVDYDGFEVTTATRFLKNLLLRSSYTFLESNDKSRAGRDQLQYTPRDRFTFEATYDFDCGFTPYASLVYVANQYFYTKNSVATVEKLQLDDYLLANVKISQKFFDNRAQLYFGVNNLFDWDYETSYGLPQAGRFIYGGVEYHFAL